MMPAYLQWLPGSIHSFAIIGHRIIWTSLFLLLGFLVCGQLGQALKPVQDKKTWPGLIAGTLLIIIPWSLFVWAPLNGETLGVAMGFFLGPLFLITVGLLVFKEKLSRLQWLATILSVLAVFFSLWLTGQVSWVALVIALSFMLYVVLRRMQPVPVITAFFWENLLLLPAACWVCIRYGNVPHPFAYEAGLLLQLSGLSLLGTLGMSFWLLASKRLPMTLLGLLGYLEPFLIFIVALVVINEKILPGQGLTYILLATAILLLIVDGLRQLSASPKPTDS